MRKWGNLSKKRFDELDPRLQDVMEYVLHNVADISILCGHRTKEEQDALFPEYTKVRWPDGKHNDLPSKAVDFQPWPPPENENKLWASLAYIAGRAVEYAKWRGITLRWGGDWDLDGDLSDQKFDDLYHLEIKE